MALIDIPGPAGILFHLNPEHVSGVAPSSEGVAGTHAVIYTTDGQKYFTPLTAEQTATKLNGK